MDVAYTRRRRRAQRAEDLHRAVTLDRDRLGLRLIDPRLASFDRGSAPPLLDRRLRIGLLHLEVAGVSLACLKSQQSRRV